MTEAATEKRRRGGREARRAVRATPDPRARRPVRGGLEGGRYKPLSEGEVARIHGAVLDVLEHVGLGDPIPSCVELLTAAGCSLSEEGRLLFPRAFVEDGIAAAGRRFVLHGQDPQHDMEPWGTRVYFGTAGAAVQTVDGLSGAYRDSTLEDLYDAARIVDALEHVHFFQRTVVPCDTATPFDLDFNTCYASVSGTSKHVGTSWVAPEHLEASLEMLHLIAGGEAAWRRRPFVSMSNCFVVPPLKFAEDACRCLELGVREGMPILLLSAAQAGATGPAALAGSVVQVMAEVLAGLIYVNAVRPGAPAILGPWLFVSDLRTGAMSGGSGEEALAMSACAQMANHYDLTGGVCGGMTDSKLPDAQSGHEKGCNHTLVGNAGANLIYESAGMHASLLGFCLESLVIDNDSIGAALRTVRGIEVSDETLSVEVIRDVCLDGPGHFLGHAQTLKLMQSEYLYPEVGDRTSPKDWLERGADNVVERAARKTRAILSSHYPRHIPAPLDERIRSTFEVKLPRQTMSPKPAGGAAEHGGES